MTRTLVSILLGMIATASIVRAQEDSSSIRANQNHLVRVVTVSQDGLQPESNLLEATMKRLNQAASFEPDIACLPETFTRAKAENVPGPTTNRLAKWARDHKCWVICPISVNDAGRVFNSAVLINRAGEMVGQYDKIHPTENELHQSVCPGKTDPPVFQTDFGKIGIQICFDVNWGDQWRTLKEKGAKIIFFPSAFPAARQVRTLAWLNQVFVVTSTKSRPAGIFDITGDTIETTGQFQQWAGAVLPLGKQLFEIDFHISKMRQIKKKYGRKVTVTWYHDDDLVSLASLAPELTVTDLIDEFDLTPHPVYIRRAQLAQDKQREATSRR